jgi:hypothetical protein
MNSVHVFRFVRSLACIVGSFLLPGLLYSQTKIEGQVLNGTSNRPVAGQAVSLLVPRQGMQKVAAVTTDSSGHFAFNQSEIDTKGFYLLESVFQGVPYHAPVLFQSATPVTANVDVYEHTSLASVLRVEQLLIGVRAAGHKADVQEQFTIKNSSRPPRAFVDPRGTFVFHLSPAAGEPSVAVKGLMDMQLPQNVERGKLPGDYAIHYPLKPGANAITVSYQADYSTAKLLLEGRVPYAIERAELYVMPSSLAVESTSFKPAGADAANNVQKLAAQALAPGSVLEAKLSGPGLPQSSAGDRGEPGGASESSGTEPQVKTIPTSMTNLALPLLGCFLLVLLWALGVRIAKEWPKLKQRAERQGQGVNQRSRKISGKADRLLNSLADLDELFAGGKIAEKDYWKERLELKARVVAALKKTPSQPAEPYASRRSPR